jgi:hypothetical protein
LDNHLEGVCFAEFCNARCNDLTPLERHPRVNCKGLPIEVRCDSSCWLVKEASSDSQALFIGFVRAGCRCGSVGPIMPGSGIDRCVSVARAVKWPQRLRASGSASAKPMGGRRPYLLADEEA